MKILHNNRVSLHNKNETQGDGPYRIREFTETVSDLEIQDLYNKSEEYIKLVHPENYLAEIKKACEVRGEIAEVDLTPETYEALLVSTALIFKALENDDFAVVRPGGHHASKSHAEGFCLINSEAIPTQYILNQGKRVAIIDIDAHHGNGTQDIFKNEENVLYSSIHQIGKYPYTGDINDVGRKGNKIINIPIRSGSGDDVFLESLDYIIEEVKEFNPDNIIVVAGFDGHGADPLLSLNYSKQGYLEAGSRISKLKIPTFALLAGGYHNEVKGCADSFIAGFNGEEFNTNEKLTTSSYECLNHLKLMFKYMNKPEETENTKSEIDKIFDDF